MTDHLTAALERLRQVLDGLGSWDAGGAPVVSLTVEQARAILAWIEGARRHLRGDVENVSCSWSRWHEDDELWREDDDEHEPPADEAALREGCDHCDALYLLAEAGEVEHEPGDAHRDVTPSNSGACPLCVALGTTDYNEHVGHVEEEAAAAPLPRPASGWISPSALAEAIREEREACLGIARRWEAAYPTDVFLPDSDSLDAKAARHGAAVAHGIAREIEERGDAPKGGSS